MVQIYITLHRNDYLVLFFLGQCFYILDVMYIPKLFLNSFSQDGKLEIPHISSVCIQVHGVYH